MAKLSYLSTAALDVMGDALLARLSAGILKIRTVSMPADGDTTPSGTLLATFTLATPAGTSVGGLLTITAPSDVTCVATGEAAVAELLESDDTTKVCVFNVGETAGQFCLVVTDASFQSGALARISSFSITIPGTGA